MTAVARAAQGLRAMAPLLRERDDRDVLEALGRLLETWGEPGGRWPSALARALASAAGFSDANVREGLRLALEAWDEAALRELVARELGGRRGAARLGPALTSIVCAGAIPMPTLLQIVLSLVVRSPALVKPAARDPVTPVLVASSLAEIDPVLGRCVAVVPLDTRDETALRELLASDCIVASGSDAALAALRRRLEPGHHFVGYGHRFSIAAIGASALGAETAAALALDVSLWDQLGCMSPIAVYVVGSQPAAREAFAAQLARALEEREREAPLGEIDAASAALVRRERDEARMRLAGSARGRLLEGDALRWTVVLEPDARARPAPLHRFVRIHPVPDVDALREALGPDLARLSTVAVAGLGDPPPGLGDARPCAPGWMQRPPLGAPHDGRPLLLPLLADS